MAGRSSNLRIAMTGLAALALAMGIGRFVFTPLLPMMRADGLIDIVGGGVLASVHFFGYWVGAVSAARLPFSPRAACYAALTVIGLSTLGMGLTDAFPVWLVLRWLAGVCSAWMLVLVGTYPAGALAAAKSGGAVYQGWLFGGVGAGICLAGLACLAFMTFGVPSAGSWLVIGAATLAAALLVARVLGPALPGARVSPARRSASDRVPLDWWAVIAYGAMGMGYVIPATYLPVMARAIMDEPLVFGWSWPVFGAAAFASTLLAARLYARYGNRRIWAVSQMVLAAGVVLPAVVPHILAVMAAGLAVGGTFMIITMAGIKEAHRIAPAPDTARHIAALTAAFATGQMAGPVCASLVHEVSGQFSAALIATGVLLLVTAVPLVARAGRGAAAKSQTMGDGRSQDWL